MFYNSEGDINPARFVTASASANNTVKQSVADDRPLGISGQAEKDARVDCANTLAAEAGDQVLVHNGTGIDTDATVMIELGGTVAFDGPLMPTTGGKAIAATTGKWFGAYAQMSGVAGDIIPCRPIPASVMA
jgi:hypothetical protein